LDNKASICSIGRKGNTFYPIVPKMDYKPHHQTRATTKGGMNSSFYKIATSVQTETGRRHEQIQR